MTREQELRAALKRMCEYANYLGNEVLVKLGNANYAGDFVEQWEHLLKENGDVNERRSIQV